MKASRLNGFATIAALALQAPLPLLAQGITSDGAMTPVTVKSFARAETDMYFSRIVKRGGFGKFDHNREVTPISRQEVVRMNRDTLYSAAVFDLDAGPVTITLPDSGKRYMALLIVNEDHYTQAVVYAPGRYTFSRDQMGTRYFAGLVRTLVDPQSSSDIRKANALQDAIQVEQAATGRFEVPRWDPASQSKIRDALSILASMEATPTPPRFGRKEDVDPVSHLIGTAAGWGGNPEEAARYIAVYPKANDGKTVHSLTVKDVPVKGFWSISLYNKDGFFEPNALGAYSINNLTAKPNADGSVTVQFGACETGTTNCLPTPPDWNYVVRLYRPGKAILDGSWTFPEANPVR
jgi:para-nitrobenzyl esterase